MESPEEIASAVILAIAAMVLVGRMIGTLFARIRQPAVIGEMLAGIVLGPSLLGLLPGDPVGRLFPEEIRLSLYVVATIGLVIFMFVVGLELQVDLVRGHGKVAAIVSVASITLPFSLGVLLGLWLYPTHGSEDLGRLPFVLFIGASMSVTAFPVLARILAERGMDKAPTGVLALACAAVDDVLAWIMLAGVLAVLSASQEGSGGAHGDVNLADLASVAGLSVAFVLFMFYVVRPNLRRLIAMRQRHGALTPTVFAIVLVGILLSSYATTEIGIHAIFGAFLFGAIMPRAGGAELSRDILERVEQLTVLLFLPVFFISTGLKVDLSALGQRGLLELLAILGVACAGKFLGATIAARLTGIRWRRASALGVLMNTRGLTELIILNVGREKGVLDEELFSVLVVMAIATTVMTEPLLRLVYPDRALRREIAQAERAALASEAEYRVLAVVPPAGSDALVDVGSALLGPAPASELVVAQLDEEPRRLEIGNGLAFSADRAVAAFAGSQLIEDRARLSGADAVVHVRATVDLAADVLHLVEASAAEVVLLGRSDEGLVQAVLAAAECVVVRPVGPLGDLGPAGSDRPDRIGLVLGSGADATAAATQAARCSIRNEAVLEVVTTSDRRDQRAAANLVDRLTRAGVRAELGAPETDRPAAVWTFTGEGDLIASGDVPGLLAVRAAPGDYGDSLEQFLDSLGR